MKTLVLSALLFGALSHAAEKNPCVMEEAEDRAAYAAFRAAKNDAEAAADKPVEERYAAHIAFGVALHRHEAAVAALKACQSKAKAPKR